jgi:hypothetical protein
METTQMPYNWWMYICTAIYYSDIQNYKTVSFTGKWMEHHDKQSKPHSERQRSHVFSHRSKYEYKDYIYIIYSIYTICIYI